MKFGCFAKTPQFYNLSLLFDLLLLPRRLQLQVLRENFNPASTSFPCNLVSTEVSTVS